MANSDDVLFNLALNELRKLQSTLLSKVQANHQQEMDSKLQQLQLKHEADLQRLQQLQQAELQQLRADLQQSHQTVLQQYREAHAEHIAEFEDYHRLMSAEEEEDYEDDDDTADWQNLQRKYVALVEEIAGYDAKELEDDSPLDQSSESEEEDALAQEEEEEVRRLEAEMELVQENMREMQRQEMILENRWRDPSIVRHLDFIIESLEDLDEEFEVEESSDEEDEFSSPEEIRKRVKKLLKENEECAAQNHCFSRACYSCSREPSQRVVYANCGCVVCSECAEDASKTKSDPDYGYTYCVNCGIDGEFVQLYETRNEDSATNGFSRACAICVTDSPRQRAVFARCGHVICLACAEQLMLASIEEDEDLRCPICRCEGEFCKLDEEDEPE